VQYGGAMREWARLIFAAKISLLGARTRRKRDGKDKKKTRTLQNPCCKSRVVGRDCERQPKSDEDWKTARQLSLDDPENGREGGRRSLLPGRKVYAEQHATRG